VTESESARPIESGANDLFGVLSNERRRYVLSYLRDADSGGVDLSELAEWVATREVEREGDRLGTVKISLHHVHLPKLAGVGVLDYDAETNTVRYHDRPEHDRMVTLAVERTGDRL
jgi:hypothetical protein